MPGVAQPRDQRQRRRGGRIAGQERPNKRWQARNQAEDESPSSSLLSMLPQAATRLSPLLPPGNSAPCLEPGSPCSAETPLSFGCLSPAVKRAGGSVKNTFIHFIVPEPSDDARRSQSVPRDVGATATFEQQSGEQGAPSPQKSHAQSFDAETLVLSTTPMSCLRRGLSQASTADGTTSQSDSESRTPPSSPSPNPFGGALPVSDPLGFMTVSGGSGQSLLATLRASGRAVMSELQNKPGQHRR